MRIDRSEWINLGMMGLWALIHLLVVVMVKCGKQTWAARSWHQVICDEMRQGLKFVVGGGSARAARRSAFTAFPVATEVMRTTPTP